MWIENKKHEESSSQLCVLLYNHLKVQEEKHRVEKYLGCLVYQWYSATTIHGSVALYTKPLMLVFKYEKYKRMSLSTHVQCSLRGQEKYTRSL